MKQATAQRASDDRRVERRFLLEPVEVRDPETGQFLGQIVECTALGMLLVTDVPWLPGSRHRLGIRMLTGQGIGWVAVAAECVHCRPDVSQGRYAVGFQFIDPSPTFQHAIEDLLSTP